MLDVRQDGAQSWRVTRGFIRNDLLRPRIRLVDGVVKAGVCRLGVASLREGGINDLAVLIDGVVDVGPPPVHAGIGLIDAPFFADAMAMRPSRVLEQGQEALDPAVNGAAVNDEAALREPLHDIGVAQAVAHLPAHG